MATDLAVTVEDKPGALAGMGEAIGAAGINIGGVCGAAAPGGSVVHFLVDDPTGAREALEGAGFTSVAEREVVVVDVEDRPGVLGEVGRKLSDAGVNIELIYLATGTRLVVGAADLDAVRAATG
jgi:hypothetical protein